MDSAPRRAGLSMGWVACFCWPLGVGAMMFVMSRAGQSDQAFWLLAALLLGVAACVPLVYAAVAVGRWISGLFSFPNPYGCPTCGHDIRTSPHHCPNCGARLIWGELPQTHPCSAQRRRGAHDPMHAH